MSFSRDLAVLVSKGYRLNGKQISFPVTCVKGVSVSELPLSNRAVNGLRRAQIMTIEELLDPKVNLYRTRNLGVKSVKEIKNAVLNYCYERMDKEQRAAFWREVIV